jgi:hypothetical protein
MECKPPRDEIDGDQLGKGILCSNILAHFQAYKERYIREKKLQYYQGEVVFLFFSSHSQDKLRKLLPFLFSPFHDKYEVLLQMEELFREGGHLKFQLLLIS